MLFIPRSIESIRHCMGKMQFFNTKAGVPLCFKELTFQFCSLKPTVQVLNLVFLCYIVLNPSVEQPWRLSWTELMQLELQIWKEDMLSQVFFPCIKKISPECAECNMSLHQHIYSIVLMPCQDFARNPHMVLTLRTGYTPESLIW